MSNEDCKSCEAISYCDGKTKDEEISERVKQWREFSTYVEAHLTNYTVPQYGDVGEDEITGYSVKDCVSNISRYAKRYGTQSRAGQQVLDFLKIAHYAQCAWEKYINDDYNEPEYELFYSKERMEDEDNLEYLGTLQMETQTYYVYKGLK